MYGCGQTHKEEKKIIDDTKESYSSFDMINHLKPDFDKVRFDTLHNWDLGWALLEPIYKERGQEEEITFSKRLSPGQKALYFYWYLNDEVTNGGFIQFYWNGYRKYLPPIKDGLKLVGDTAIIDLIDQADKEYLANKSKFDQQKLKDDWEPLYDNLKKFDSLDNKFYKIQNNPMELLETYVRQHPDEFVNLK
jgi:hypothetical protein